MRGGLKNFFADRRAMAAIEFALLAPIALLLLVAFQVYCDALSVKRKLTIAAHSVSDLVARQSSVTTANVAAYLNAAAQIAAPYPIANMSIVVSELTTDSSGNTIVTWSQALNATALTAGAKFAPPAGMAQNGASLIYTLVSYQYAPIIGSTLIGNLTLKAGAYEPPRTSTAVSKS